jgi:hypothetical protein
MCVWGGGISLGESGKLTVLLVLLPVARELSARADWPLSFTHLCAFCPTFSSHVTELVDTVVIVLAYILKVFGSNLNRDTNCLH